MPGRQPSVDTARLLELRQRGLTYQEIADSVGLANSTVCERLARIERLLPDASEVSLFREHRASVLTQVQGMLLAGIVEKLSDIKVRAKMSAYQLAGMFGLLYDKERIELGKSTANIAVLSRLIDNGQESGDNALRKLSTTTTQVNNPKRSASAAGDNPSSDADLVSDE